MDAAVGFEPTNNGVKDRRTGPDCSTPHYNWGE